MKVQFLLLAVSLAAADARGDSIIYTLQSVVQENVTFSGASIPSVQVAGIQGATTLEVPGELKGSLEPNRLSATFSDLQALSDYARKHYCRTGERPVMPIGFQAVDQTGRVLMRTTAINRALPISQLRVSGVWQSFGESSEHAISQTIGCP